MAECGCSMAHATSEPHAEHRFIWHARCTRRATLGNMRVLGSTGFPSGITGIMELKVSYPNPAVSSCPPSNCRYVSACVLLAAAP